MDDIAMELVDGMASILDQQTLALDKITALLSSQQETLKQHLEIMKLLNQRIERLKEELLARTT